MIYMKRIIIIPLLLLFLASCSNIPVFESDGHGNLTDRANNRVYIRSGNLIAAEIMPEPFARYDGGRTLHAIPGIDPAEWLSDNTVDLGMAAVFRESSVEEPALENFGTERIHVMELGDALDMRIFTITDARQIQQITDDFVHGENISRPFDLVSRRLLYFESPAYPGLYYVLEYLTDSDGQAYLSNTGRDRCVRLTNPLR